MTRHTSQRSGSLNVGHGECWSLSSMDQCSFAQNSESACCWLEIYAVSVYSAEVPIPPPCVSLGVTSNHKFLTVQSLRVVRTGMAPIRVLQARLRRTRQITVIFGLLGFSSLSESLPLNLHAPHYGVCAYASRLPCIRLYSAALTQNSASALHNHDTHSHGSCESGKSTLPVPTDWSAPGRTRKPRRPPLSILNSSWPGVAPSWDPTKRRARAAQTAGLADRPCSRAKGCRAESRLGIAAP